MDDWKTYLVIAADGKGRTKLFCIYLNDEDEVRKRVKGWGYASACVFDDVEMCERFARKHEDALYMTSMIFDDIERCKEQVAKGQEPSVSGFEFDDWYDSQREQALMWEE